MWGLFDQTIPIAAIKESSSVLCFAAKWHDSPEIIFDSVKKSGKKKMLKSIHRLLDEAEAVLHYNGTSFDIPILNKEFVIAGMPPPSPAKNIDLLRTVRSRFKFTSSKLDYVSQALGLGRKVEHTGYQLWIDCMKGDETAWALMEKYNKGDVMLLQNVYERLLPWIRNHPNVGVYDDRSGCPHCGSDRVQKRGTSVTTTIAYQRYQCQGCGAWSRSRLSTSKKKVDLVAV